MIDVTRKDSLLSMRAAADTVGVHVKTVYGWARPIDESGRPKSRFLETAKIGGKRVTSRESLIAFTQQGPATTNEPTIRIQDRAAFLQRERDIATELKKRYGVDYTPPKE